MLIQLLMTILDIFLWLIIAQVVVSWLVVFEVINTRNKYMRKGLDILNRAVEPVMQQLRRVIPPLGGIDLTPMAAILIIYLLQGFLYEMAMR